jgi:hypothetical protein
MTGLTLSQKRAIAGARGGRRTVKRHGKRFMKKIGAWGAHVTHSRYRREPVLLSDFALVERSTGKVVALLSGRPLDEVQLPAFAPDRDDLPF